jgi:hypothetical protein
MRVSSTFNEIARWGLLPGFTPSFPAVSSADGRHGASAIADLLEPLLP